MLAGSQIEILGDTEKYLTERVVEGTRAVHPSESRASRRPRKAIAGGAKHVVFCVQVGLKEIDTYTGAIFRDTWRYVALCGDAWRCMAMHGDA